MNAQTVFAADAARDRVTFARQAHDRLRSLASHDYRIGAHVVVASRPLTAHPSDALVAVVLAYSAEKDEWGTWLNDGWSFNEGHYFGNDYARALADFCDR